MDVYKEIVRPDGSLEQKYFSERKIHDILNAIRKDTGKTKNNSFILEKGINQVTFDFIDFDKNFVFARLGRINDKNTVQIRNRVTYAKKDINTGANEDIEVYTYFLLDFDTGIISFISGTYTPSIMKLLRLEIIYRDDNFKFKIYPIVNKEVLADVMKKQYITKFDFEIALPSDNILDLDGIGLSMKDFINIHGMKYQKVNVVLKASRDRSVFKDSKIIKKLVDKLLSFGKEVKSMNVDAKNEEENIMRYNLIEHKIIQKADFKSKVNDSANYEKEVKQHLCRLYKENKENLIKFCSITNKRLE